MFPKRTAVGYRSKKSRLGKKLKNHTRLLIVVGAAVLATVLTVIWGTVWGERAQESAQKRLDARREQELLAADLPAWLPIQPPAIRAPYAGKITDLTAAVANAVLLSEEGAEAISLPLYTDGTPAYDSPTAQALGRQQTGESDVTLSRLFEAIHAEDCYIAATFSCAWQQQEDLALRRACMAYESALVTEIALGGADEVLLTDLTVDENTLREVALFLRQIRESCPEAVIGIALPTALMLDEGYVETLQTLLAHADHAALDLSDHATHVLSRTGEDGTVRRNAATVGEILDLLAHTIKRYSMRLILPADMYEQLATVEELGYDNWQIIK